MTSFTTAFVTGATGLLGNNLVRELVQRGHRVKALARSLSKAREQLGGLDIDLVEGDLTDVPAFKAALAGVDVLFHTAAFFRDSYKGGRHWDELYRVNVNGTEDLLSGLFSWSPQAGAHVDCRRARRPARLGDRRDDGSRSR